MLKLNKLFLWLSAFLVAAGIALLIPLVVWMKWWPNDLSGRALVVVVESNGQLAEADIKFYRDNKGIADFILMLFFGVKWKELQSEQILDVLDRSIDRGLADLIGQMANGYGKLVKLTGEEATSKNLSEVLKILDNQGYKTDLILHMHGSPEGLYFHSEIVSPSALSDITGKSKIGYVYQVNCFGENFLDPWTKAGAKAVNGTRGVNSMAIFAPIVFLRSFVWGETFEAAVMEGYTKEVKIWENISRVIEGIYWLSPTSVEESRPVFAGDSDYTFAK